MFKLIQTPSEKTTGQESFEQFQKEHFEEAERLRFQWQTANPLIRHYEQALLKVLLPFITSETRLLEVGCGEGANLVNLPVEFLLKSAVGVDFSVEKSRFWLESTQRAEVTENCAALCADAACLPLLDGSFDLVFCRDLLHHVAPAQQASVVAEMFRLCRPGGRVILIEANGRNPIIFLHALLIKAERGEWKSSPALFRRLVTQAGGQNLREAGYEPLPIFRLALHYRFGLPGLGRKKWAEQLFAALDKLFSWLLPSGMWAYSIVEAEKPAKA